MKTIILAFLLIPCTLLAKENHDSLYILLNKKITELGEGNQKIEFFGTYAQRQFDQDGTENTPDIEKQWVFGQNVVSLMSKSSGVMQTSNKYKYVVKGTVMLLDDEIELTISQEGSVIILTPKDFKRWFRVIHLEKQ